MARARIMGLDPGLARMGWGAIEIEGTRLTYVAHGVLTSDPRAALAARLLVLHDALMDVLAQLEPHAIAIEQAFVHKDPSAAMKIGQARAVAMLAGAQGNACCDRPRRRCDSGNEPSHPFHVHLRGGERRVYSRPNNSRASCLGVAPHS